MKVSVIRSPGCRKIHAGRGGHYQSGRFVRLCVYGLDFVIWYGGAA